LISKPVPADKFAAFLADHTLAELKAHAANTALLRKVRQTGKHG
jgi:hypothetical protein